MANYDVEANPNFADKRHVAKITAATNASAEAELANYGTVSTLRTRLAAIDGTYYTTARLNQMSKNDMVFALRNKTGDSAGI